MQRKGNRRSVRRRTNSRAPKRNRKRFDFKKLIMPMLVLVIATGITYGIVQLLTTPSLAVRHVHVSGARLLADSIIESEASPLLGRNVIALHSASVVARIKKHPEIRDVRISRRLPRTIIVHVTEKTPFLTVTNGSGFWLVDSGGLPYHRVGVPAKSAPIISLPADVAITPGRMVSGSGLSDAIQCIRACPAIGSRIAKISVDRAGNLCLNMGSDYYVKLGQPMEIPQKMDTLARLMAAQPGIGQHVECINVSCYDRPAVRPKVTADAKPENSM